MTILISFAVIAAQLALLLVYFAFGARYTLAYLAVIFALGMMI